MKSNNHLIKKGFWFFIINTIFLLIIASRYFKYFTDINHLSTIIYLCILTISHFVAISLLGYLLYLLFIIFHKRKIFARIVASTIATLISIALLLDTFIYELYRMHFNKFTFDLLFSSNANEIFVLNSKQYIIIFLVVLIFFFLFFYLSKKIFDSDKILLLNKELLIIVSIVIMMFSSHMIHAWAFANNQSSILKSSRYYPLYFPTVDNELMLKLRLVDSANLNNTVLANNENKDLDYPKNIIQIDSNSKTNIILILLDSWYFKSFDSTTMPNIYRFSKECDIYTNHYSGSNATRSGMFSLFYSIPAIYWQSFLTSNKCPVFMDVLLRNNYEVKTFPSASLSNPPFDKTIFSKNKNICLSTNGENPAYRDALLVNNWLEFSSSQNIKNHPFFSFVFFDALHGICHPSDFKGPFQPAWEYAKYEQLNNNTNVTPFLNLYKNVAYYEDSIVGILLRDIKKKGLLENSIVIISADHGQEFNDNKKNYWGHNGNYTDAQMHVPLIIHNTNTSHKTYNHWTAHYDIIPTLMKELFNCKNQISDYSIGKYLTDTTKRNSLVVGSSDDFAIIENQKRITKIYYTGVYDITDDHLNPISNAKLNHIEINKLMSVANSFYKKK